MGFSVTADRVHHVYTADGAAMIWLLKVQTLQSSATAGFVQRRKAFGKQKQF
jgi:hypothetical protein